MLKAYYRAKDAAEYLGIHKSTFWLWVQEGRIAKGKKLSPRCTVWPREELDRFVERQTASVSAKGSMEAGACNWPCSGASQAGPVSTTKNETRTDEGAVRVSTR